MGKDAQAAIRPADLHRGDRLIFVTAVNPAPTARSSARPAIERASASEVSPSALPREAASLAAPGEVVEVMVFRPAR